MMSRLQLLLCISVLCLQLYQRAFSQDECEFIVDPEDRTVEINDTNVELTCTPGLNTEQVITWQIFLRNGTFWSVTASDTEVQRMRGLEFVSATRSLIIRTVQPFHTGLYRCEGLGIVERCRYFSDNASITVRGPAEVEISNGPMFMIDTTERLLISGTVNGQPDPNVTLYKVENGREVVISSDQMRIAVTLDAVKLIITIDDVRVSDGGMYRVKAANEVGGSYAEFTIITQGPDRPYVTVPGIVVAGLHQLVTVSCSVQPTAYIDNSELELKWKVNDSIISSSDSSSIYYVTQESSIRLTLTIRNVTHSGDNITCEAQNIKNVSQANTMIYIPPTPPKPTIEGDMVFWDHMRIDAPVILYYIVNIYEADTDKVVAIRNMSVPSVDGRLSITLGDLDPGEYDIRVVAVASAEGSRAMSNPSPPARYVRATDAISVAVIAPVAGSVGGVLILIVIGVLVGAFFFCFYSPYRRQMNSQQQRWGSEEDKVDSAVPNTYTTLALGNSELPPSPNTPLISSFFSTVDPKWEFPRENIQLKDVLHEGQFTILYKGTVKGIKERMIDVAIKSVRDDANEDDVKALVSEMETLAGLGPHPNIVSLLRVCTVGSPMYIVMEYMCHGDLLGFLRASRGHHGFYHISPGTRYQPPTLNLCSRDLLNVATKIANGMRYLSDRKVVHRALCAKNVLVGPGMDIKIYNVGSFDISFENREYYMKWMAPETLFDHTTTTYSDVWSYGITLWELVTVGGTPYAEILPQDLYSQLHNGMRMPKPQHCAQEVYDIMWQCWQRNPTDRPHFAVVHESLEELLESKISYLDLRQYDGYAYSQFDDAPPQFSTAL